MRRRLPAYATCAALACGFLAFGLRLDRADLTVPLLYEADALLILPMVVAQHEGGTHWVTDRLGAPGRQELYDFPVIDHLHFAAIAALDHVAGDPVVAFNGYFLLTYPLTALCAMAAGRSLGLSLPAAGCLGLLYAFLPYHQMRGLSHYFLSAYYLVPLALVVVVNLALGRVRGRRVVGPVVVMAATSCAGAYYAFFTCALLAVAGLVGADLRRSLRPLGWGTLLIAVVFAGGVMNHLPTILHQREFGHNTGPVQRQPEDSEVYALKLTYLVLPIPDHRIPAFARWRSGHDSVDRSLQADANAAMLGVVGVAGLLIAAVTLFRARHRHRVRRAVSVVMAGAFLVATVGGVGALYSDLIDPAARGLARMSVFLGFLALWLALVTLDRRLRGRWRVARWPVFVGVTVLGLADTTPRDWGRGSRVEARAAVEKRYAEDGAFYRQVEEIVGGGAVFQLPFNDYPEGVRLRGFPGVGSYDQARGFLHTRQTRWSYGAMRGRDSDQWQRTVSSAPTPEVLRRVVLRGFDGLIVDGRAFAAADAATLAATLAVALPPPLRHAPGDLAFYDLRPYRDRLKAELGAGYDDAVQAEAEAVYALWFKGFASFEPLGREDTHRWCGRRGEAWLVNPSAGPRRVTMTMVPRTESAQPTTLRITGGVWQEALAIDSASGVHAVTVELPPGRHRVEFACDPPRDWVPRDARRHVFFLAQFTLTESP